MENHITINQIFSLMPIRYKIRGGVERLVIDNFIKLNNRMDWISGISKTIRKDPGGVEKIVKNLTKKNVLKEVNCPQELFKKREKGGAKPHKCYLLNYDMDPEWFVEIARPHLNDDDKKIRLDFMNSEFTHRMIHYEKFITWVIENRLIIKLNDDEKYLLPFIFNSFPSSLRWVLFGDLSIVDKCISDITIIEPEIDLRKRFYFAYINSKIIEDFVEGCYLQQKSLSRIRYSFTTEFKFLNLFPQKSKGMEEKSYGTLTGGSIFEFKKNSKKKNL